MTCWICYGDTREYIEFPISVFTGNNQDDYFEDNPNNNPNNNPTNSITVNLQLNVQPPYITRKKIDNLHLQYYNICHYCSEKYLDFRNINILRVLQMREIRGTNQS